MKIETLRKCTAGCVCVSFLLLASCVDEAYDLGKDLDLTIQVGGDLRLPGCNTEEITLKDLFDLDEDDPDNVIKADAAGFYSLRKSGEGSDSEIDIRKVEVEDVEAMDAESELHFMKQELDYAGRAESYIDEDKSHFEFSNEEVTKDLVSITWARPEADIPVTIRLFFDHETNEVPVLHLMDDITMYVPTFLELEVDEARLPADERGDYEVRPLDASDPAAYQGRYQKLVFHAEKSVRHGSTLEIPLSISRLLFTEMVEGQGLILHPELEYNELFVSDDIIISGTAYLLASDFPDSIAPADDVQMVLSTSIQFGEEASAVKFTIASAQGVIDPEIDVTVDPVGFDNLPDFLEDDDVRIDLENPQILLTVANTAPVDVNIYGDLVARRGNEAVRVGIGKGPDGDALHATEPILIRGNATTAICLSRQGTGAPEGGVNVKVENLNDLIERIPDEISMENITAKVLQQEYEFDLGTTYYVSTSYDVDAPLSFGPGTEIAYKDTVDNWNGDINEYDVDIKKLTVTMDAINKIPLNLELSVLPIDVDGNVMPGDEVKVTVPERILPGNGLEGDPDGGTLTSVVVEMETLEEGALRRLDGIVFDVRANNRDDADYQNVPLNENQTLKLDNIRIRIPGGVKLDLNDKDDE